MTRILIFSVTYLPFVGGAEVAVKEITDRIGPGDIEFDMITLRFDRSLPRVEKKGNITVYRVGFSSKSPSMADLFRFPLALNKYLFPFLSAAKAASLHRKRAYDAVWSIMANYAGFAALFFTATAPRIPFLLTLQEGDSREHIERRVRFIRPLFKAIFKRATHVQCISNFLASFARDMGYQGALAVIPNGAAIEAFSAKPPENKLEKLKGALGKNAETKLLFTSSRLVKKNAVSDIITALTHLPPRVKLAIAGTGPEEQSLRKLAAEIGVSDRCVFLGHIEHEKLPLYLAAADIFVRPSLSEGMGNSFIEAMAARVPVIATPVGGIVDFLFDPAANPSQPPTGLYCEVNNPKSIAEQVTKLIDTPQLGNTLAENAFKLVSEKYDWQQAARAMRDVFGKLVKEQYTI